ncbi:hypothetical protein [Sphingopyxis sp.]|jgi:hypothetical protein|uniref:hypothetical protein n=1 Tax=Sphingopyxis sp. TaxID=1908224 RepID=UPI003F724808
MLTLMMSLALSAATAETPAAQPTTETAAEPEKTKPKLVCRRIADTGSRLPQRECRTQEDWDRQADSISKRLNGDK